MWSFCAAAAVIGADGPADPYALIRANDGSSTRLWHSGATAFEAVCSEALGNPPGLAPVAHEAPPGAIPRRALMVIAVSGRAC